MTAILFPGWKLCLKVMRLTHMPFLRIHLLLLCLYPLSRCLLVVVLVYLVSHARSLALTKYSRIALTNDLRHPRVLSFIFTTFPPSSSRVTVLRLLFPFLVLLGVRCFPFPCVVSWARAPLLMPHCFSKWCAALLHLFGACALLFPWPRFCCSCCSTFLGWRCAANGVLDLVFAFCWFRSIGPAVPAAPLFFEIVCSNIARPWCWCWCCYRRHACVWSWSFPFRPASLSVLYVARDSCV